MTEPDEDAQLIHLVVERLMKTHPHLDDRVVRVSVQTAYDELRYARVRTYLPVLMERRAKDLLPDDERGERDV
ncbi:three-helix bundle dimerization domain-containing protein [Streptomyces sp. NPDC059070]|uniref:three-helix bundle dimerization domain-containing protein n=1 Tax=unclassified Streptomyces TaxID=2593676 RepID=UPI0034E1FB7D